MFMQTRKGMFTAKQIRGGNLQQGAKRLRPNKNRLNRDRLNLKNKTNSLTVTTRQGNREIKEPTATIKPETAGAAELVDLVAAEAEEAEVEVVVANIWMNVQ